MDVKTKICVRCTHEKSINDFGINQSHADGHRNACKDCYNEVTQVYERSIVGKAKRQAKSSTPQSRFNRALHHARRENHEWSLSLDEYSVLIAKSCEYCGFELPKFGVGLDRVDNTLGYRAANVVPCCTECNTAKNDLFSFDEMKQVIGPAIKSVKTARLANIIMTHFPSEIYGR